MIINKSYFKKYSVIPENYDLTELLNYIPVTEKIWIIPVIGQDFYDELDEQVSANTLTPENGTLLTYGGLWQYLCFATTLEALPMIWSHVSQVGLTLGKSDNSDSLSLKDITYVEAHLRRQVETLKDQLIEFLDTHQASYPLYQPKNCGCKDNCSCQPKGHLNSPNQMVQLYTPPRKDVDIK